MLQSISIKNFALVEDIQLQFQSGLNILTGETGAGKSLILNAIGLLLGRRATRESIRSGAKRAIIEGQWKVTRQNPLWRDLEDYAVEPDQELIIRREVNERGISRALVNDALVPLQTISKVTDWLVDLHGQHQHQLLLNAESHILFFDEVMLAKEKRVQTAEAYQAVLQSRENFARVRADLQQSENRREEAQAIYDELLTAKLFTGEYEDLQTELKQLENKEEIAVLYEKAASLIEEAENGLRHRRQHLLDVLARLATFIPEMDKLRAELVAVDSTYTEISAMADRSRMDIDFDPQEVEKMRHRQQQLRALQKKYNLDENGLIALCKQQEANLKQLNSADKNLAAAENDYRQKREAFGVLAGELSQLRQAQREPLAKAFRNALAKLGMPETQMQVIVKQKEKNGGEALLNGIYYKGTEAGIDELEFYISANPGEAAKPLNKIASGGELSRIMLAMKTILARSENIPSLVFDEIDVGISGKIADAVGQAMAELAHRHQIICITHLPQLAAYADTHFRVAKHSDGQRTKTSVAVLSADERINELMQMLGSGQSTPEFRQSAIALLQQAKGSEWKSL